MRRMPSDEGDISACDVMAIVWPKERLSNRSAPDGQCRPPLGGVFAMISVIVNGARTPMGKLLGNLKDFSATQLGGVAIKAALQRAGVSPEQVQYVIMGQVLQAGAGQIPARQAAVNAG